ncbi:phosphoribosyltransferase family protein [Rhizohabitans arisaemae]|uniref:phosphoribosyltransferase family protein n=1 Tax=Rhizohabitans arisaemae TaxID=2720610 RepID=UPI0024B1B992|nr:phosphoribosyltransferase family protein [Rhizohabitans arisaemae]
MFANRQDAGAQLAERLRSQAGAANLVVVGLPRGGVPVAFEVARTLGAPLDVILVRKLGVPYQPELGFGAIGEGGVRVLNQDIVRLAGVTQQQMAAVEDRERPELQRRARRFRGDRPPLDLAGRTVIVVDDGIATGGTARAACQVARSRGAARVVLAVPVGPPSTAATMADVADEVVCLQTPPFFHAIGAWYRDFAQTGDAEVVDLLRRAAAFAHKNETGHHLREVEVDVGGVQLPGQLALPEDATGIVVFVHGSGSGRHSPRNRHVAGRLNRAGLATLLFDLLTPEEELDRRNVFDIGLLSRRTVEATGWLNRVPETAGLPLGYFGASTGAAAALCAAADLGDDIAAVVSRGGRPDLAEPRLDAVRAPTLLIVGGRDELVLELNRAARKHLRCESGLEIVPGATHLFAEPGALEQVAALARDWFAGHFRPLAAATRSRRPS